MNAKNDDGKYRVECSEGLVDITAEDIVNLTDIGDELEVCKNTFWYQFKIYTWFVGRGNCNSFPPTLSSHLRTGSDCEKGSRKDLSSPIL